MIPAYELFRNIILTSQYLRLYIYILSFPNLHYFAERIYGISQESEQLRRRHVKKIIVTYPCSCFWQQIQNCTFCGFNGMIFIKIPWISAGVSRLFRTSYKFSQARIFGKFSEENVIYILHANFRLVNFRDNFLFLIKTASFHSLCYIVSQILEPVTSLPLNQYFLFYRKFSLG